METGGGLQRPNTNVEFVDEFIPRDDEILVFPKESKLQLLQTVDATPQRFTAASLQQVIRREWNRLHKNRGLPLPDYICGHEDFGFPTPSLREAISFFLLFGVIGNEVPLRILDELQYLAFLTECEEDPLPKDAKIVKGQHERPLLPSDLFRFKLARHRQFYSYLECRGDYYKTGSPDTFPTKDKMKVRLTVVPAAGIDLAASVYRPDCNGVIEIVLHKHRRAASENQAAVPDVYVDDDNRRWAAFTPEITARFVHEDGREFRAQAWVTGWIYGVCLRDSYRTGIALTNEEASMISTGLGLSFVLAEIRQRILIENQYFDAHLDAGRPLEFPDYTILWLVGTGRNIYDAMYALHEFFRFTRREQHPSRPPRRPVGVNYLIFRHHFDPFFPKIAVNPPFCFRCLTVGHFMSDGNNCVLRDDEPENFEHD